MPAKIFNDTCCALGEGALWHPKRNELFWFDILNFKLFASDGKSVREWRFEEHVSAAGWVDTEQLLMASESGLYHFTISTSQMTLIAPLEADNPVTRSNDGRADPAGGFWIGTMGKNAEPGAGAIYRFYRGEVRMLFDEITISNAICFSPDARTAYYTDTSSGIVKKVELDGNGWPAGLPADFLDFSQEEFGPDGAVIDQNGVFWNAQWGAGRVAGYGADGKIVGAFEVPTPQSTCPSFDADGNLYITTAADGRDDDEHAGKTYIVATNIVGQREHRVML